MIKYICDKCDKEMAEYSEFRYLKTTLLDQGKGLGKALVQKILCKVCTDEIVSLIEARIDLRNVKK